MDQPRLARLGSYALPQPLLFHCFPSLLISFTCLQIHILANSRSHSQKITHSHCDTHTHTHTHTHLTHFFSLPSHTLALSILSLLAETV